MIIVGVDIGKKGGIAKLVGGSVFVEPLPFDKENELIVRQLANQFARVDIAFIEQPYIPHGMANKGTMTAVTDYGQILAMAKYMCSDVRIVPPRVWKRALGLSKDKQESIDMAKELFPRINLLRTERSRKECDGLAESILIAHYGAQTLL